MRILIATDGSDHARSAARSLLAFPIPPASRALVLSATPVFSGRSAPASADRLQSRMRELATEAVQETSQIVRSRFESVETSVASGDPRSAILGAAEKWKADMIVIGARGLGTMGAMLLGSISDGIARHATCPVLVVKGDAPAARTITIGIDDSEGAAAAAAFVAGLPLPAGTTVRLVAVVEPPSFLATVPENLDPGLGRAMVSLEEDLRAMLGKALDRVRPLFSSGVTVETAVLHGPAAHELVADCGERRSDLLVVGARGVGTFERILLGSVSNAVLHHAPCSVLVVKRP